MAYQIQEDQIRRKYPGVLSLLRFLRRAGRLSDIDKFASAPDPDTALEILQQVMALLYRSYAPGGICHREKLREEEAEKFKFLCGKDCVKNGELVVKCPRLPSEGELESLRRDLKEGKLKPSTLAALALARRRS